MMDKAIKAYGQDRAWQILRGAEICIAFWMGRDDADMVADARARRARVLDGTANEVDILGALDWLDEMDA